MKAHIARNQNAGIPLALGWNLSAADRGILEGMAPAFGMKLLLVSPADAGRTVAQLLGEVEVRTTRTLVLEPGAYPPALVLANFKDKDVDTPAGPAEAGAGKTSPLKARGDPRQPQLGVRRSAGPPAGGARRLYRRKGEPDRMKSRITRMTAALLAAVLSLGLLVGCKPKKELTRYTTIFYDVFDTVTQVIAYCDSEEEFTARWTHSTPTLWSTTSSMIFIMITMA